LGDEEPAGQKLHAALTAGDPTPEELLEDRRARALVDELETRIPDPVNRLIVHLFFFQEFTCTEIVGTVRRLCGLELTPKAVERRKAKATRRLTREWGKALSGEHCRELAVEGATAGDDALTRYALGLLNLEDSNDRRLHDIVAAHLRHCVACRSAAAATRREVRQLALLTAPILIGVSQHTDHTGQQAIAHAPGVFDRALDTVRSGIGRGTVRAAETLPSGASAGEMAGSAAGAGGTALTGGLAAKVLIVGTTAICAFGGQQLCVHLLASPPIPKRHSLHTVALRPKLPHKQAAVTPSVRAAQVQPRAGATASQQLAHRAHVAAVHRAQRRAAARSSAASTPSPSTPSNSSASSSSTASAASTRSSSDPSLSPTEPTTSPSRSSASGSSSGSSSGGSASSGSSGDSTFQGLP